MEDLHASVGLSSSFHLIIVHKSLFYHCSSESSVCIFCMLDMFIFIYFTTEDISNSTLYSPNEGKNLSIKLFKHSWASMTSQPKNLSTFPQLFPFLKQRDAHGEQVASSEQSADGLYTLLWALRPKARETHKGTPMDQTLARGSMACQEFLSPVLKDGEAVHKYFTAFSPLKSILHLGRARRSFSFRLCLLQWIVTLWRK